MKNQKLYRKYSNKKVNAHKEKIDFLLSFEEYEQLVKDANITVDDIGIKGYHLARYNDTGNYELGNCRFIYYLDNYAEKKITIATREAARQNIVNFMASVSVDEKHKIAKKAAATRKNNGTEHVIWESLTDDIINDRITIIKV